MSISANYPSPVTINGYACKNCTDVDYAKKNIDPAHPKDGPYGVAKTDKGAGAPQDSATASKVSPAVAFGGSLSAIAAAHGASSAGLLSAQAYRLDLRA